MYIMRVTLKGLKYYKLSRRILGSKPSPTKEGNKMVEAKFANIVTKEVKWLPVKVSDLSKEEWTAMSYDSRWSWWEKAEKSITPPEGMWLVLMRFSWGTITTRNCVKEVWQHPRWGRISGPTFVGNA